jgi:hypothetical protein
VLRKYFWVFTLPALQKTKAFFPPASLKAAENAETTHSLTQRRKELILDHGAKKGKMEREKAPKILTWAKFFAMMR